MSNHLVPTTIVNKNGIRTTVHKKPAVDPSGTTKLPSVTLPTIGADRQRLLNETAEALTHQNSEPPLTELDATLRAKNYQSLLAVLPAFSDESLRRFAATAGTDLGWDLNEFLCNSSPDEEYVNDWIVIEPIAREECLDSVPILQGLQQYKNLTPQKDGHYPDRRNEEVIAITRVTAHLMDLGYGMDYGVNDQEFNMEFIEDEKVRDFLTTHENPSAVTDLIISRNLTDPDQITALLQVKTNTANAINEGIL